MQGLFLLWEPYHQLHYIPWLMPRRFEGNHPSNDNNVVLDVARHHGPVHLLVERNHQVDPRGLVLQTPGSTRASVEGLY